MKKRIKHLTLEKLNRQINKKKDLSLKLLKGIKKCQNKSNLINVHINHILNSNNNKFLSVLQQNRCQVTGRLKGCVNYFRMSRHVIKKRGVYGLLQNFKIKNW